LTEDFIEVGSECRIRSSMLAEFGGKGEPEENRFNPKPHFKAFEIGGVQLCLS